MVQGEICDIDGTCVDAADDEIFKLTTKGGSLSMEREKVSPRLQLLVLLNMIHITCTLCGRSWRQWPVQFCCCSR